PWGRGGLSAAAGQRSTVSVSYALLAGPVRVRPCVAGRLNDDAQHGEIVRDPDQINNYGKPLVSDAKYEPSERPHARQDQCGENQQLPLDELKRGLLPLNRLRCDDKSKRASEVHTSNCGPQGLDPERE